MIIDEKVLNFDEKNIYRFRSLYAKFGYKQYKLSKFEEYDLYSKNKDFLVSDRVITFTDTNGKLMALKPDVTLSLIKNNNDNPSLLKKLCYNENVYRVTKNGNSFKEIMQIGIECIGNIDSYCIYEVLYLAKESLKEISPSYCLDVSSLDILNVCINKFAKNSNEIEELLKLIDNKNISGIEEYCKKENIDCEDSKYLLELLKISSSPKNALPKIKKICEELNILNYYFDLEEALKYLQEDNITIDFSVIQDLNYYNGIVFKGFIEGIPGSLLSGGQYDKLMNKMKKKSKGIGFAIYLEMLDYMEENEANEVDVVIIYDDLNEKLKNKIIELTKENKSIYVCKEIDPKIKYKTIISLKEMEEQ